MALIACFGIVYAGALTPLPGVAYIGFPQGVGRLMGAAAPLCFLVVVRWFAGLASSEWRRKAPWIYLGATALWAYRLAEQLEAFGSGRSLLVLEPGLEFRILVVASLVGAGALLWLMAEWVTSTGIGEGGALIGGTWFGLGTVEDSLREGMALGRNQDFEVALMVPGLAGAVVLAVLAVRSPSWPVNTRYVQLRSWVDATVLPAAAALVAWQVFGWLGVASPSTGGWVALPVALGLVWEILRREGSRSVTLALVALLVGGVTVGAPALGWLASGGAERAFALGPFHGESVLMVELRSDAPAPGDADRLLRRMEELRVDGGVDDRGHTLQLELIGVSRERELLAVLLEPGRFAIRGVDEDLTQVLEQGFGAHLPPDREQATYCWAGDACEALVLKPATITNAQLTRTSVAWDSNDRPYVLIELTAEGRERLENLTKNRIGHRLALIVDEIRSTPVVLEALTGGQIRVDMGGADDPGRQAWIVHAQLASGPLEATWEVAAVR